MSKGGETRTEFLEKFSANDLESISTMEEHQVVPMDITIAIKLYMDRDQEPIEGIVDELEDRI